MAQVSELELPELDFFDVGLKGDRFHAAMDELSRAGWLAASPIGYFVLDRESAAFFLRTRAATFPGMKIAGMFEVPEGPLLEQMRRNILHINGDDHRRLRNLVNPAFTPRAADRWRPAMRDFLARLWEPLAQSERCEFVDAFAKPYPSLTIATVMGAPLGGHHRDGLRFHGQPRRRGRRRRRLRTADRGAAKPLTFGAGIHYCLGANLARAELQEALTFLPARMPGLAFDGEPELGSVHGIYGLDSLPIRWTTA